MNILFYAILHLAETLMVELLIKLNLGIIFPGASYMFHHDLYSTHLGLVQHSETAKKKMFFFSV